MADQNPDQPPRPMVDPDPDHPPRLASYRPESHQLLDASQGFTPYYVPAAQAGQFPNHATRYLHNDLNHPPQEFPEPRNPFPGTDPIKDARGESGVKPGELSYEQVQALTDVKNLTVVERHARDAKEFPVTPPDILSQGQKQEWTALFTELFQQNNEDPKGPKNSEDPFNQRARGHLRKLKELAELAGGKQE